MNYFIYKAILNQENNTKIDLDFQFKQHNIILSHICAEVCLW